MKSWGGRGGAFRFQVSALRFLDRFPLSERAGFGGHAELRPGAAATFAAAAGGVQRGGVPLIAGTAGRFAVGEDFGWRGGEARAGEAVRRVAEAGEHLGAAGKDFWRNENAFFFQIQPFLNYIFSHCYEITTVTLLVFVVVGFSGQFPSESAGSKRDVIMLSGISNV